jgi:hypothetical protein
VSFGCWSPFRLVVDSLDIETHDNQILDPVIRPAI